MIEYIKKLIVIKTSFLYLIIKDVYSIIRNTNNFLTTYYLKLNI